MKKAINKLMSFLAAFAMVLGILAAPFSSARAGEVEEQPEAPATTANGGETETLTIHKILMDNDTFGAFTEGTTGKDGTEYVGNEITNVKDFFAGKDAGENAAKEIAGVYFKLQEPNDGVTNPDVNKDSDWKDLGEDYEGLTTANGLELDTKGLSGTYRIVEVHEKSTYVGEDGKTLTDKKAVPSIIVLPLVNNDGVVTDAHMYPKNTEEAPKIDKNFAEDNELTEAEGNFDEYYTDEENNGTSVEDIKVGPQYENYQKKKKIAEAEIGKQIPYGVKTEIPANSNLKLAKWDDNMSAGLTYNKDLTLTIGSNEVKNTENTTYYTINETDSGFVLTLEEEGLKLINGQTEAVTVALAYTATVNSDAIVDIPEINDVKFNYGNNPSKATEPKSTTPNEGKITVKKTWDNGSNFEDGEWADFKLINATTGREVTADDLVQGDLSDEEFANIKKEFKSTVRLSKGTTETHTWENLDGETEYTAIEIGSQTLSDAEYTVAADGTIQVTNHKSNNPEPLNPTEPKVVLGGKKFVKTNEAGTERLAGAEFYVKNGTGEDAQYLVAAKQNAQAVTDAKTALDNAVTAYNDRVQGENESDTDFEKREADLKAAIDSAQEAYNKAFKENATAYTWGTKDDANVVVLTSDGQGRFEISGLEYGTYYLEEKTAPAGYAKRNDSPEFKVEKDSYKGAETELQYNEANTDNGYGLQVKNKKVSIPQTGGIGSLIFIVAGLAIMGVAFVAMRRRNAVNA